MLIPIVLVALVAAARALPNPHQPTVKVLNGTYVGTRNDNYKQDFFLGIPYAQQPLGNLRFRVPQSLNETWEGEREATDYSPICPGYGTDSIWYPHSEACLTLNVVRDSSVKKNSKLPVAVWIHGGGFTQGSSADQRYNMSFIVENSYKIGKPFIAVSINYRLSAWGFSLSEELIGTGNTNIGLRDQRLALRWVKENIGAFGGEPDKVVIWGESAGAMSVGLHLTAYGGRDDKLFRGAIMESGAAIQSMQSSTYQSHYDDLIKKVNCSQSLDNLQCLRDLPFDQLNTAINTSYTDYGPALDGDIVRNWGSQHLSRNEFVKVPILIGTNTDEGRSFSVHGVNTTEDLYNVLMAGQYMPPIDALAKQILELYPEEEYGQIPAEIAAPGLGKQFLRTAAFVGDLIMHSERRQVSEYYAGAGVPAYSYRFNVHSGAVPLWMGAGHFEEVAFVFNNLNNVGYHYGNPFENMPESYKDLSNLITSMWASFIHDLNPNTGVHDIFETEWPKYTTDKAVNMVLDANVTSHTEEDIWRAEAIGYLNSHRTTFQM